MFFLTVENDIDGETFLELSEDDIRSVVPKLGAVKKIVRLQKVSGYSIDIVVI